MKKFSNELYFRHTSHIEPFLRSFADAEVAKYVKLNLCYGGTHWFAVVSFEGPEDKFEVFKEIYESSLDYGPDG